MTRFARNAAGGAPAWAAIATVIVVVIALLPTPSRGATFRVTVAQDADLPRILLTAVAGDTVLLGPGDYRGKYAIPAGVVFQSLAGPDSTRLRGTFIATVEIQGKSDVITEIRGFTMVGRGGADLGVQDPGVSALVENCVFTDLHDGVQVKSGEPAIIRNAFRGCRRGIALSGANGVIDENTFDGNSTSISLASSSPSIRGNRIKGSSEGILLEEYSYPIIGGGLNEANDFIENGRHLVNRTYSTVGIVRTQDSAVVTAKYNYWGTECPPIEKFFGQCRIKPWTDAEHSRRITECAEPSGTPGGKTP